MGINTKEMGFETTSSKRGCPSTSHIVLLDSYVKISKFYGILNPDVRISPSKTAPKPRFEIKTTKFIKKGFFSESCAANFNLGLQGALVVKPLNLQRLVQNRFKTTIMRHAIEAK